MEGHRSETSPDYKMTNFPDKWCSSKWLMRFFHAVTALTAYALGTYTGALSANILLMIT
jgi:hypothetical protein